MATKRRAPWETRGYSDLVDARIADGMLEVVFANGDEVSVPLMRLGIDDATDAYLAEDKATEVVIVRPGGEGDLDWMQIRAATDADFAKELRRRDAEESRRLGRRLKALREDRGLRQSDVADIVGMTAPQLSKIEKGQTDMRISTVRSLLRAMDASFADIAGEGAPEFSRIDVIRAAVRTGMPKEILDRLLDRVPRTQRGEMWERYAGQPLPSLLAGDPVARPQLTISFKARADQKPEASPLLHLALNAASLAAAVAPQTRMKRLPDDPGKARPLFVDDAGQVTLASLLRGAWEAGLVVVPIIGTRGGFSALAAVIDGRPSIVLKDARKEQVFWLFVLAHEIGHHARGHVGSGAIVDIDAPDPQDRDRQEREANNYALDLLVPGYREMLAEIRADAEGPRANVRFKFAVEDVARAHHVNAALLAMIAAYEMPDVAEPKDRWGSAMNLAKLEAPAAEVVRSVVADYLRLDELEGYEAALLRTLLDL